jgi:hypothetical protein
VVLPVAGGLPVPVLSTDDDAMATEGHPAEVGDLATITPYIRRTIRRFGDWILDSPRPA